MHADAKNFKGCRQQCQTFAASRAEFRRYDASFTAREIDQNEPAMPWVRQPLFGLFPTTDVTVAMLQSERIAGGREPDLRYPPVDTNW